MKGSRRYYGRRKRTFPASLTCGWTQATGERTRSKTGHSRPWQSVQPKQLLFAELGELFEPRVSGPGERTAGLASPGGRSSFSRRSCRTFSTLVPHQTTPWLATYGNDPKSKPTDPK